MFLNPPSPSLSCIKSWFQAGSSLVGIVFVRQNLTCADVRFSRIKTVPALHVVFTQPHADCWERVRFSPHGPCMREADTPNTPVRIREASLIPTGCKYSHFDSAHPASNTAQSTCTVMDLSVFNGVNEILSRHSSLSFSYRNHMFYFIT